MDEDSNLIEFAERLQEEVIRCTQAEDDEAGGAFEQNEYTRYMAEVLVDAGELDDYVICYHKGNRSKLNGYYYNQDEDSLDLFISIYKTGIPPITVGKADVETAFRKLHSFFESSVKGYHKKLEETSPGYDAARLIFEIQKKVMRVRMFVFTDGLTTLGIKESEEINRISFSYHVWDLRRTYRCKTSGQQRETIQIDFRKQYGESIPCLPTQTCGEDFEACVAMIPGRILSKIYEQYGSRLLERNVRAFLQIRGRVNKEIRDTIVKHPERFLAYNNGISATAEYVEFDTPKGGNQWSIISVKNFQIVNGGQTTASLYYAHKRYKADLSKVFVQAKISIVKKPELVEDIVPKISRYANSQNKISDADFFANDAFHTKIESFSRTVWAPATGGTQRQTQWYYERARGQFTDEKARNKKSTFESTFPVKQMITKTDLAKFENTWAELPHMVNRGAQKNFRVFTDSIARNPDLKIDETYFKNLISKALLFRTTEAIVKDQGFAGYRAQVVNLTVAYLVKHRREEIDLNTIWKEQKLSPALQSAIGKISKEVHKCISNPPDGQNVTEWCKKESCWNTVAQLEIVLPEHF